VSKEGLDEGGLCSGILSGTWEAKTELSAEKEVDEADDQKAHSAAPGFNAGLRASPKEGVS
jgi:hypothetical protein